LSAVEPFLDACDQVLVMSVMPGFGGQQFDPVAIEKLRTLRRSAPELLLAVDGGINSQTIGSVTEAGANLLVAGTALFSHADYTQRLRELRAAAMGDGKARMDL